MSSLKDRFNNFAMESGVPWSDREVVDIKWQDIQRAYSSNGRYYHTMNHLAHCFEEYDLIKHVLELPLAVEGAIWYHDYVYETGEDSYLNEQLSAEASMVALQSMDANFPGMTRVPWLIMETAHRYPARNNDAKYLQDIDLCVIGLPWGKFVLYDEGINLEYSNFPALTFMEKRKAFLEGLVPQHGHIFNTWHFVNRYESSARDNIKRMIDIYAEKIAEMKS